MAIGTISSHARAELTRAQARLDADISTRDAAQRAVDQDTDTVGRVQQAARRELQSRSARGTVVDVTV
ncbi:hypothetical protein ACQP2F_35800 [Actinoplanes sp. CA-030573]|uniref:hypothetical protein n=1 Tax=Actinoplanes sp. CA-030573 TaxID=3239898 RepID=UPI003D912392